MATIIANIRGLINFMTDNNTNKNKRNKKGETKGNIRSNSCPNTPRKRSYVPPLQKQETNPNFANPFVMYDA